jgi:hypothetical protein
MVSNKDDVPEVMQKQEWFKEQPTRCTASVGEVDHRWKEWYDRYGIRLDSVWWCSVGGQDPEYKGCDCFLRRGHNGQHARYDGLGVVMVRWGAGIEEIFGLEADGRW